MRPRQRRGTVLAQAMAEALDEHLELRTGRGRVQQGVELLVLDRLPVDIVLSRRGLASLKLCPKRLHHFRRRPLGRASGREHFQRTAYLEDLVDLRDRKARDLRAGVREDDHEPFGREMPEGLTDRRTADAVPRRDLRLA